MNLQLELERVVVSSLIESDEHIEYRDVDEDVFMLDVHRWIVRHIKKAKSANYPIKLMTMKLEEQLANNSSIRMWQDEYLHTLATQPMATWYKYYQELKARKIKREARKMLMED